MASTFDFADVTYPERPSFFCVAVMRGALAAGVLAELGPRCFAMLCVVAEMEDRLRYSRAPNWTNAQMADALAIHPDTVEDVRATLVRAGWLHYQQRHRRPGVYWVTVPPAWEEAAGLTGPWSVSTPVNTPTKGPTNTPVNTPTLQSYPYPYPQSSNPPILQSSNPSPPPPEERSARKTASDPWAEVVVAMDEVDINHHEKPLERLKANQVPPELALRVLRIARQIGAWNPGRIRARLMTLRPDQDPENFKKWPDPDHAERLRRHLTTSKPAGSGLPERGDRVARLRQLELQFDGELRGRATATIVRSVALPDAVRDRLLQYPRWDMVRSDELRLIVLERLAAMRSPTLAQ